MDDLHYYTNDLFNVVLEKVQEGETIYVDDDIWNDMYMEDEFADLYDKESEDWDND